MRNGLVQDKGTCVGLDVGTTKVCCIIAQSDGNGGDMKLLGAGVAPSYGVKRGTVVDIDATIQAIENAVHKAETMANVKVSEAYVGLSGDHIRGLNTQGAIAISKNGHPVTYEDEIKNFVVGVSNSTPCSVSFSSAQPPELFQRIAEHIPTKLYKKSRFYGISSKIGS